MSQVILNYPGIKYFSKFMLTYILYTYYWLTNPRRVKVAKIVRFSIRLKKGKDTELGIRKSEVSP